MEDECVYVETADSLSSVITYKKVEGKLLQKMKSRENNSEFDFLYNVSGEKFKERTGRKIN